MSMIAVVPSPNPALPPCVLKWAGRRGLSVVATTYCGREHPVAAGIMQIPSDAKHCESCKAAIAATPR
jgi:hypothetical protein